MICQAQVSGLVFRDYNLNGLRDSTDLYFEPGEQGMIVKLTDRFGNVLQTSSDSLGYFNFQTLAGPSYRIEFFPIKTMDFSGPINNAGTASSVRFIHEDPTFIIYGINYPEDYCRDAKIMTPCYVIGDPLHPNSDFKDLEAFVSWNASNGGKDFNSIVPQMQGGMADNLDKLSTAKEIGSCWGLAYQKQTNTIITSAVLKRHAGMGPQGPGGLYFIDGQTNTVIGSLDLNSIGVPSGLFPNNADRHLPQTFPPISADSLAFSSVGKISYGGMEISEDGKTLYIVGLHTKKLYSIFIDQPFRMPSLIDVDSFAIPQLNCQNGQFRPWAIRQRRGKLYIGGVCDASGIGGNSSDLIANVQEFDPINKSFTTVLDFSFDYEIIPDNPRFFPWVDVWDPMWPQAPAEFFQKPQPILSDIEFDGDDFMILGVMDRLSLQTGVNQMSTSGTGTYSVLSLGDLLRASLNRNTGKFELEHNASDGIRQTAGRNTGFGPGGGEYYHGDVAVDHALANIEPESLAGGLAHCPGSQLIISTSTDVYDSYTNGVVQLDNRYGSWEKRFQIIPADFTLYIGKSNALGDLKLRSTPAPLEIGNYVWRDLNGDGIQDPIEPPLPDITLELLHNGTVIGLATTNSLGQYIFSNAPPPADNPFPNSFIYGINELTENETYTVRIPDYSSQIGLVNLLATTAPGINPLLHEIDNNGLQNGIHIETQLKSGLFGHNNHSIDFGFNPQMHGEVSNPRINISPCNGQLGSFDLDITVDVMNGPVGDLMVVLSTGEKRRVPGKSMGTIQYTFKNIPTNGIEDVTLQIYYVNDTTIRLEIPNAFDQPAPCCENNYQICTNRENIIELSAPDGFQFYCWYISSSGTVISKLQNLPILSTTAGLEDSVETYYFIAIDSLGDTIRQHCGYTITMIECCGIKVTNQFQTECNNNGTLYDLTDDWFAVFLQVDNPDPGLSNQFEVVFNGDVMKTIPYGSGDVVGTSINRPFKADGQSIYKIIIRDVDNPTCQDSVITAISSCPAPQIKLEKSLISTEVQSDASYIVRYRITVHNEGDDVGFYNLIDDPEFDNDLIINSSFYTTNIPGKGGAALLGTGPWTLVSNQLIQPGTTHTISITFNVRAELSQNSQGDGIYTPCGTALGNLPSSGEGLFNRALLDLGADGSNDLIDTVCAELAILTLDKEILSTNQTEKNQHEILYRIIVKNNGGISGSYNLIDRPGWDDDISITSAELKTSFGMEILLPNNVPLIGWIIAQNRSLNPLGSDTFLLTIHGELDLNPSSLGNNSYRTCGWTNPLIPRTGEGLFNVAMLDLTNDLRPERRDSICGDLSQIIHTKSISGSNYHSDGTQTLTYQILVANEGGKSTQYSLWDKPQFDDDIVILDAKYTINSEPEQTIGNILPSSGWQLVSQKSLDGSKVDTILLQVHLMLDLSDSSPGDQVFNDCQYFGDQYIPENGLFNESLLDYNSDGIPDQRDTVCSQFDYYDLALRKISLNINPVNKGSNAAFRITVFNQGNQIAKKIQILDYLTLAYVFDPNNNPGWVKTNDSTLSFEISELAPGDSLNIDLILQTSSFIQDKPFDINASEIGSFLSIELKQTVDVDSSPDADKYNDNQPTPNGPDDDQIAGKRKFRIHEDEDDHDVATTSFFDLALRKVLVTPPPYRYNDILNFKISIYNQGNVASSKVDIVDYIPKGYQFEPSINPGWSYHGDKAIYTHTQEIVPGDSAEIFIYLTFIQTDHPSKWINEAEIQHSYIKYFHLIYFVQNDLDSKPDSIKGNDAGGYVKSDSDDHINDDGLDYNLDGITDEDDHDPAVPFVWDLALVKYLKSVAPHFPEQNLEFVITIHNQGTDTVGSVGILDYLTLAYQFDQSLNPGWVQNGKFLEYFLQSKINPGDSASISLFLKLNKGKRPLDDYINYAEIKSSSDIRGNDRTGFDLDSEESSDSDEERTVIPGGLDDNNTLRNGAAGVEDDHDPAVPEIFDLALRKTLLTNTPVKYGQEIEFKITIFNQGLIAASEIEIVDYLPEGLEFVLQANWNYNPVNRKAYYIWSGILESGDSIELSIRLRVHSKYSGGMELTNYSEIKSAKDYSGLIYTRDIDSFFDEDPFNDIGGEVESATDNHITDDGFDSDQDGIQDEDDHDPSFVPLVDFALIKEILTPYSVAVGDTVLFKMVVYNQGNIPSSRITVIDYINHAFEFPTNQFPGWAYNLQNNMEYTFQNTLLPGQSDSVYLRLKIGQVNQVSDLFNYAEILRVWDTIHQEIAHLDADSYPGSNTAREQEVIPSHPWDNVKDQGGNAVNQDEDDHDVAGVFGRAKLGDMVWHDKNANGIMDFGEEAIKGIVVQLFSLPNKSFIKSTSTNSNGKYLFEDLPPGNYYVRFIVPSPWIVTSALSGSNHELDSDLDGTFGNGTTRMITLNAGDEDLSWDLGLYQCMQISGAIFYDNNKDGIRQANESGINGLTIYLHDLSTKKVITTTRTAYDGKEPVFHDGNYRFCVKPGAYYIRAHALSGFVVTKFQQGTDQKIDSDLSEQFGPFTSIPISGLSCDTISNLGGGVFNPNWIKLEKEQIEKWDGNVDDSNNFYSITNKDTDHNDIVIYPNPAHNELYLHYPCDSEKGFLVEIMNLYGQNVPIFKMEYDQKNEYQKFDISHLLDGTYLIKVICNDVQTYRMLQKISSR